MKKTMDKAYEPGKYEDKIYADWEKSGCFNPDKLGLGKEAESYTISMPPPNRTGTLHMGHAAMLAIEDILIRYHRMQGKRALWLPGTDHAAIATQAKVEKIIRREGESRHSLGREKFLKRVVDFAAESHDTITRQVRKMGSSCDWSREAYTLDETRNKAVNTVFKMMYDDSLIYRGERIVNWCPRCHSTLSDDEVEYKSEPAKLYTFKYSPDFPFAIATTRPETKLADTAVAVHPDDKRYRDYVGQVYDIEFAGVKLKLKIIADRGIDPEFGTGALGVTPAHSHIDWQLAENNDLAIVKLINEDGRIHQGFGDYSGLGVIEARDKAVGRLRKQGLIEKEEEMEHNLSLCYRCDTPVEPLPSRQWFIDVNKPLQMPNYENRPASSGLGGVKMSNKVDWNNKSIKDVCIDAVGQGKIRIIPERFEKNYFHWIENLRDWCISRQIWFGHRVPVYYRRSEDEATEKADDPRSAIHDQEIFVGIEPPEGENWVQDEDTLDTWFSSGMWTFSTLAHSPDEIRVENGNLLIDSEDFRRYHPTQVLETGYDILFFWVARMIIMTTYALGDIPFENVYLHGLVLDEEGKKMSKSKGNVIDPLDMCDRYGTDATRLSLVIGSTPGSDLRISEEKIAGQRNLVNKLWNMGRYILANAELQMPNVEFDSAKLTLADKFILSRLNSTIGQVSGYLEKYQFSAAGEALREFSWSDLADWYIEASKFQKGDETDKVLAYVLNNLLKLWHPFIPFVTEAIWQEFNDSKLIVAEWPESDPDSRFRKEENDFETIKAIIGGIRNARAENKVEPGRKIKAVIAAGETAELLKENEALIKGMRTGIEELDIKDKGERIEQAIYVPAGEIDIYLLGAVDPAKEKKRTKDAIARLDQRIAGLEKKLANKEFTDKAPAKIVEKEKKRLKELVKEKIKLEKQYKNL